MLKSTLPRDPRAQGLLCQDDNHGPIPEYLEFAHEWPNINHPQIRAATLEFLRAVARHFRGHPALLGYCTFNEVHDTKADRWALEQFVIFLERQYGGDISRLNAAWATFHRRFDEIRRSTSRRIAAYFAVFGSKVSARAM